MAALGRESAAYVADLAARGVDAALPPQLPPSLTPPPLPLLLPCTLFPLPAAVRSAYRGLGVLVGGEATPVVVLCREYESKKVMAALVEEGAPVQGYYTTGDRQGLEAFLTNPRGVLCTHQDSFSGLECRLLLWIAAGALVPRFLPMDPELGLRYHDERLCFGPTMLHSIGTSLLHYSW